MEEKSQSGRKWIDPKEMSKALITAPARERSFEFGAFSLKPFKLTLGKNPGMHKFPTLRNFVIDNSLSR